MSKQNSTPQPDPQRQRAVTIVFFLLTLAGGALMSTQPQIGIVFLTLAAAVAAWLIRDKLVVPRFEIPGMFVVYVAIAAVGAWFVYAVRDIPPNIGVTLQQSPAFPA